MSPDRQRILPFTRSPTDCAGPWCSRRAFDGLALFRQARHHIQKKTAHASEQQRGDVKAARQAWFDGQLDLDPARLVFAEFYSANVRSSDHFHGAVCLRDSHASQFWVGDGADLENARIYYLYRTLADRDNIVRSTVRNPVDRQLKPWIDGHAFQSKNAERTFMNFGERLTLDKPMKALHP